MGFGENVFTVESDGTVKLMDKQMLNLFNLTLSPGPAKQPSAPIKLPNPVNEWNFPLYLSGGFMVQPENDSNNVNMPYMMTHGDKSNGNPERFGSFQAQIGDTPATIALYTKASIVGGGNDGLQHRVDFGIGNGATPPSGNNRLDESAKLDLPHWRNMTLRNDHNHDAIFRVSAPNRTNGDYYSYVQWGHADSSNNFRSQYTWEVHNHNAAHMRLYSQTLNDVMVEHRSDGSTNFRGYPVFGLKEYSNPSAGQLTAGEWGFDTANSRWLYRLADGSATHYYTSDGTL